jgi:hypothetical protein
MQAVVKLLLIATLRALRQHRRRRAIQYALLAASCLALERRRSGRSSVPQLPPRRLRASLDGPVHVANMSPEHYDALFRFRQEDFPVLQRVFGLPDYVVVPGSGVTCDAWDALGILFRRLASPVRFADLERLFRRSKTAIFEIYKYTLKRVFALGRDRVQRFSREFLTDDVLLEMCDRMQAKGCVVPRVFASIDCMALDYTMSPVLQLLPRALPSS